MKQPCKCCNGRGYIITRLYKPKRNMRYLEGAPDYVLAVFDHEKTADRYDVFFCGELLSEHKGSTVLAYLVMSERPSHPQGVSMWADMTDLQYKGYIKYNKHKRIKWLDLPLNVRNHVISRAKP